VAKRCTPRRIAIASISVSIRRRNFSTIDDTSVDVVLCVGALEHMLDRDQVIR